MADEQKPPDGTITGGYEVGYGKPPRKTRFKPGRSGNPRGRPKGTKNLKTDLMEELGEKILIREGDQSRKVSKQRALVKSLFARALKGDARTASLLMSTMMRLLDTGEGAPAVEESLLDDELEILRNYEDRVRRGEDGYASAAADSGDRQEESS